MALLVIFALIVILGVIFTFAIIETLRLLACALVTLIFLALIGA